jgi:hypothetical protein
MNKYELYDKIKLSYLRHRGNASEVAVSLSLPIDYVRKVCGKFKKDESRDVSVRISNLLMQHVLLGYESRVRNLQDMLDKLAGREQISVSNCCKKPVDMQEGAIRCLGCGKVLTSVMLIDRETIYKLRQELVVSLRDEDKFLVDFAEKMGYTKRPPVEPAPSFQQKNYQFVFKKGDLPEDLKEVMGDIRQMSPMDREKFRKRLEQQVVEGDIHEKEGDKGKR